MDYGYASNFEREVSAEIKKQRDNIAVQIVSGSGISDFEDYRFLCGHVAGFERALDIMAEVRARLLKPQE